MAVKNKSMKMFQSAKLWIFLLLLSFAMTIYGQNNIAYNTDIYEGNIYNHALSMCLNYEKKYFELTWDTVLISSVLPHLERFLPKHRGNTIIVALNYDDAVRYLKEHGKKYFFRIYPLAYSYKDGLFCVSVERRESFVKRNFFRLSKRKKNIFFTSNSATYKIYYKFEDNQFVFVDIK